MGYELTKENPMERTDNHYRAKLYRKGDTYRIEWTGGLQGDIELADHTIDIFMHVEIAAHYRGYKIFAPDVVLVIEDKDGNIMENPLTEPNPHLDEETFGREAPDAGSAQKRFLSVGQVN
tara:strand:- start:1559 stop:1918 length:360 start_codon:yes stop_codon:yes gene_type:complete